MVFERRSVLEHEQFLKERRIHPGSFLVASLHAVLNKIFWPVQSKTLNKKSNRNLNYNFNFII